MARRPREERAVCLPDHRLLVGARRGSFPAQYLSAAEKRANGARVTRNDLPGTVPRSSMPGPRSRDRREPRPSRSTTRVVPRSRRRGWRGRGLNVGPVRGIDGLGRSARTPYGDLQTSRGTRMSGSRRAVKGRSRGSSAGARSRARLDWTQPSARSTSPQRNASAPADSRRSLAFGRTGRSVARDSVLHIRLRAHRSRASRPAASRQPVLRRRTPAGRSVWRCSAACARPRTDETLDATGPCIGRRSSSRELLRHACASR